MSTPNDGGPAFPAPEIRNLNGDIHQYAEPGMPLRDYFAASIIGTVYFEYHRHAEKHGWDANWHRGVSDNAYAIADAMLEARKGGKP